MSSNGLDPGIYALTTRLPPPKGIKGPIFFGIALFVTMPLKSQQVHEEISKLIKKISQEKVDKDRAMNLRQKDIKQKI